MSRIFQKIKTRTTTKTRKITFKKRNQKRCPTCGKFRK